MDVWTTRKNNTTVAVEGACLTARAKFCDKSGLTTPLRGIAAQLCPAPFEPEMVKTAQRGFDLSIS